MNWFPPVLLKSYPGTLQITLVSLTNSAFTVTFIMVKLSVMAPYWSLHVRGEVW